MFRTHSCSGGSIQMSLTIYQNAYFNVVFKICFLSFFLVILVLGQMWARIVVEKEKSKFQSICWAKRVENFPKYIIQSYRFTAFSLKKIEGTLILS